MGEAALDVDLRQLAPRLEFFQHAAADDVDGDAAGDFTGAVATHAIGEHREARLAVGEDGVLVMRPHHAGMGQRGHVERGAGLVH